MTSNLQADDNELSEDSDLYEHHRFVVDPGQGLLRIDKYLGYKLEKTSRNRIQKAIEAESVKVNGKPVKSNYRVKPLDVITLVFAHPPHENLLLPEQMTLHIIFEDEHVLVVNKPAGLVVHPGHGNYTGTLVNGLLWHLQHLPVSSHPQAGKYDEMRPGLVHRIDKDTSGVMVIAKNEFAMTHLARQFFERTIQRNYLALVWGDPANDNGLINAAIGRDKRDRKGMAVYENDPDAKHAITHYTVVERLRFVSVIRCKLETGRTHQIRVHMKHVGHPLFNDPVYGGTRIIKGMDTAKYKQFVQNCFALLPGQALHAATLGFQHPTSGNQLFFEVPLPDNFLQLINKWRNYTHAQHN